MVQGVLMGTLMMKGEGCRRWVFVLAAESQFIPQAGRTEDQLLTACSGGDSAWTTVVGQRRVVAANAVTAVGTMARLNHVSLITSFTKGSGM